MRETIEDTLDSALHAGYNDIRIVTHMQKKTMLVKALRISNATRKEYVEGQLRMS